MDSPQTIEPTFATYERLFGAHENWYGTEYILSKYPSPLASLYCSMFNFPNLLKITDASYSVNDCTAADLAALYNNNEVLKKLTNVEISFSSIKAVVENNQEETLDIIANTHNPDFSEEENILIRLACRENMKEIASILLQDQKVDISGNDYECILFACKDSNSVELLKTLCSERTISSPNQSSNWLNILCETNNWEGFEIILQQDNIVVPDDLFETCCSYLYVEGVELLLLYADIGQDKLINCLKNASKFGDEQLITLILQYTDVDARVEDNYCIKIACAYGNLNVVKLLLKHGAVDIDVHADYCLMQAIDNGHTDIALEILVNYKVLLGLGVMKQMFYNMKVLQIMYKGKN